eukprot:TRINITY_DN4893_c0_g1_i1.p1 TRINITY_DN4893_c0_g1~~TRINITY_DN4893_c0_g1_i1.p1  ORF type:complete len:448 (+),score=101.82 TRINITY_DN4893_c0_g1_i1:82-1425(+)
MADGVSSTEEEITYYIPEPPPPPPPDYFLILSLSRSRSRKNTIDNGDNNNDDDDDDVSTDKGATLQEELMHTAVNKAIKRSYRKTIMGKLQSLRSPHMSSSSPHLSPPSPSLSSTSPSIKSPRFSLSSPHLSHTPTSFPSPSPSPFTNCTVVKLSYPPNWETDVYVFPKMRVGELWSRVAAEDQMQLVVNKGDYAFFTEDDEILADKDKIEKLKLSPGAVLTIKKRNKVHVKSLLSHFLEARPTRDNPETQKMCTSRNTMKNSPPDVGMIEACIDYLTFTEAYKVEGIFRISASALDQREFYTTFTNRNPDFTIVTSPHTVSSTIKQHIRSLPAGLIGESVATPMREAYKMFQEDELNVQLAKLIALLPETNYKAISILFEFILLVIENEETTKMGIPNCAIVFGPTVFAQSAVTADLMAISHVQTCIVEILLQHYDFIFKSHRILS